VEDIFCFVYAGFLFVYAVEFNKSELSESDSDSELEFAALGAGAGAAGGVPVLADEVEAAGVESAGKGGVTALFDLSVGATVDRTVVSAVKKDIQNSVVQ
jgi:hypothetical protein